MAVDDYLRAAIGAEGESSRRLREAMLTLALAEAGPGAAWAERCRARLVADRPDHFLAAHPTLALVLADPRAVRALDRLRARYPAARVRWLRLGLEASSGPYTGQTAPLGALLDALIGAPAEADVRRDRPVATRGPTARARVGKAVARPAAVHAWPSPAGRDEPIPIPIPIPSPAGPEAEDVTAEGFYLAVLLSIAILLATARQDQDRRAA